MCNGMDRQATTKKIEQLWRNVQCYGIWMRISEDMKRPSHYMRHVWTQASACWETTIPTHWAASIDSHLLAEKWMQRGVQRPTHGVAKFVHSSIIHHCEAVKSVIRLQRNESCWVVLSFCYFIFIGVVCHCVKMWCLSFFLQISVPETKHIP